MKTAEKPTNLYKRCVQTGSEESREEEEKDGGFRNSMKEAAEHECNMWMSVPHLDNGSSKLDLREAFPPGIPNRK